MSRTLQWVLGVSAALIALATVFAAVGPWVASWLGWQSGYGMTRVPAHWAGVGGITGGRGMMGALGSPQGQAPWAGAGGFGMMGNGYGMMGGGYGLTQAPAPWAGVPGTRYRVSPGNASRISLDQARKLAEDYATTVGSDLAVAEVMEFENNFYALVKESDSGHGALELLIDPYTGAVGPEPGPNMMWNDRYGHMSFGAGGENRLSMDEARAFAQQALDTQLPGSKAHEDGAAFYGYFTFDFDNANGTIAGMLSVEGSTGAVWLHTWHGSFVAEWEAEEMPS